jgi:hydroxypyruvate isomerase
MPKYSANLGFLWPELSLLERIDAAADAGFRAIELHWPFDIAASDIRAACLRRDLQLLGINTPPGDRSKGEFGLAALPGRGGDFAEAFLMTAGYARAAGASAIHIMTGIARDRDGALGTLLANLELASAQAPDLTLLLEAINIHDAPGYFYSRSVDVKDVIVKLARPNLRMMFDCYHVGRMGDDVLESLERFMPLIGHVQIAGVPDRSEPDHGSVNYREVLGALDRLGYAGWVGCEYRPRGDTNAGLGWPARLGFPLPGA